MRSIREYRWLQYILLTMLFINYRPSESASIARGKTTSSSTVVGTDRGTDKAVDGDFDKNNYFRTQYDIANQWWRVDLGKLYYIVQIKVTCYYPKRFKDVSILVTSEPTTSADPDPASSEWSVVMSGISLTAPATTVTYDPISRGDIVPNATQVALYRTSNDGLAVTEVEVFGYENAALGKTTSASSVFASRVASWAVDGIVNDGNYYRSDQSEDNWWRVDLAENFFIIDVKIYYVVGQSGKASKASLLLGNSSTNPALAGTQWSPVFLQIEAPPSDCEVCYFEYNPIAETDPIPLARYIAVYSEFSSGLAISEVLVFAAGKDDFSPNNLQATLGDRDDCAKVSWEPPITGALVYYETRYDKGNWQSVGSSLITQICSLQQYKTVDFDVRVLRSTTSASVTITDLCAEPSKPTYLPEEHELVEKSSDSQHWECKFTWEAPDDINCDSITSYEVRYPNDTSTAIDVGTDTSTVVSADGNVEITFSVRAKNNVNLYSEYRTMTFTTEKIEPLWGEDATADLRADNSSCVTLSWTKPQYPGELLHYEYLCTQSSDWTTIEATKLSTQICRYSAYTQVQCDVIAVNSQGESEANNASSVRTPCAAPVLPEDISNYMTEQGHNLNGTAEERIKIKLDIPRQDIVVNCESLTSLEYKLASDTVYTANGEYIDSLTVLTEYTINIRVVNNENQESVVYWTFTTGELPAPVVYQCEAPPAIENAMLIDGQSERSIDSFVVYSCKVGFTQTQGDVLRCKLRVEAAVWTGEIPKCEKPTSPKGLTIGLSIPLALLAITVIILVSVICTIKRRQSQANSAAPETDISMTTIPASNAAYLGDHRNQSDEYMKLGGDRSSHTYDSVSAAREPGLKPATAGKSDVYVNVN